MTHSNDDKYLVIYSDYGVLKAKGVFNTYDDALVEIRANGGTPIKLQYTHAMRGVCCACGRNSALKT